MNLDEIRELIKLMKENNLTEIDIESSGEHVRLRAETPPPQHIAYHTMPPLMALPTGAAAPEPQSSAADEPLEGQVTTVIIKSPIVGTYYQSASPDKPVFVQTGDTIDENLGALHHRSHEGDERNQGRNARNRARNPGAKRPAGRVRPAALRHRADPLTRPVSAMAQDPQDRKLNPATLLLGLLLALNFLTRAAVALRPLACIDGLMIPDDAYLSLKIARSIAQGLGPFYGAAYTNGFQPLYVFLSVPFYWIWPRDLVAPVHAALVMLAVFDTLSLFFLWRLAARRGRSLAAPLFAAAAWIFSPRILSTSLNGLETSIAFFLIVAVFDAFDRLSATPEHSIRRDLSLGALIGLAILARIDSIFLLPAIALTPAYRQSHPDFHKTHGAHRPGRLRPSTSRGWSILIITPAIFSQSAAARCA